MYHTNSKQLFSSGYQVASWLPPVLADHDNDFLAELLGSPYWSMQVGAALELGRRGDKRATNTLAEAFYDAVPSTRADIVAVLGEIADEEVLKLFVEVLETAVDSSSLVKRGVANAMTAIAQRERRASSGMWEALAGASDLLVWQVLRDDDKAASDAAAIALAAIQGEEAITMIKEFSDHSLSERLKVIDGLMAMKSELGAERIGAELMKELEMRKAGVRLAALRGLLELREENNRLQKGSERLNKMRPTTHVQLLVRFGLERMKVQPSGYSKSKAATKHYQMATQY